MTMRLFLCLLISILYVSVANAKEAVVYSRLTDGFWQLWIMDSDGENNKQITFSKKDKFEPFWMPDEQRLGYRTSNGELFLIDIAGGHIEEILSGIKPISNPDFAKTSGDLVFVRFSPSTRDVGDIWKTSMRAGANAILTKDLFLSSQPSITSDGKFIVFVKIDEQRNHHLWLMDSNGTEQKQLTQGLGRRAQPDISDDGEQVIFSSNQENGDFDLYWMNLKSAVLKKIVGKEGLDTHPRFSPDGKEIVFVSNRSGAEQIWSIDLTGENLRQLTYEARSIDPQWIEVDRE